MKKLLGIMVLGLLLSGNAFAKVGKGELKLSRYTMESLMLYMYGASNPKYSDGANKKNKPMLMVISEDGKSSYYYYCPYDSCVTGNYVYKAIKFCEKSSNGSPCYLFATKRKIKWKNSINTKSTNIKKKLLKEPYQIAKIIQDLGFYDGDISELPGIDYNTAKLDNTTKITGKKENYDYPSLIASLSMSHKDSWKDYVEGGSEKYKAWVMVKRKDKDFSWGFEADDTSWNDVIKKAFNRCNKYIKQKPKSYPDKAICILYYKGTTPTTDNEKIKTARIYYGESKANIFFDKYPYVLNKKINFEKEKQIEQSSDIISQIKELKKLLDEEVLTKEEFEKAKKKLLN
tara:strand:+ start:30 stop:1061 length:1032 start_codon:yes stop_codon:yes gene_type:complete